ncbi:Sterol O-acyltransferase 2 [Phlyctema vagabunda]|uniref:Sterol O-acyltransferase 2 n=1 Tax=Phlyctema vagabunda TaxID=108571 RepID=A0ABR4PMQ7_9HELO
METPPPNSRASSSSSVVGVQQLVGHLNADGLASLKVDKTYNLPGSDIKPPRSLKLALDAASGKSGSSDIDTASESASEEDYDALKVDPLTVRSGGKGGGYNSASLRTTVTEEKIFTELQTSAQTRPSINRLKSIPITLKKSSEKGRYLLRADDEVLKEVLRMNIEREKNPASAKRRSKFSDLVFTRQFTAFDRNNAESASSPFHGFFVLFWLAIAIMVLRIAGANWRESGNVLGTNEIMAMMFHRDVLVLAISDGVLCGSTGFGFLLQKAIQKGWLSWNRVGWILQSVWELFYLIAFVGWTLFREWPWTHTVFFVLHGLIMLMKQHSYAFYLGHLSEAFKNRAVLEQKLKQLDNIDPVQTPSATTPAVSSLSTSYLDHKPAQSDMNQRRPYHRNKSVDMGDSNIGRVAMAIESGEPLDADQIQAFERIIAWEIDALSEDLKGKSTTIAHYYPNNLNVINHYEYIVLPTLVYELEYPRSETINWFYVAEKSIATFGILAIMNMVSQAYIYPVVIRTLEMKEAGFTVQQRLVEFPLVLSDLVFPFLLEFLMSWYIIWECILNVLAEVTYFADRGFYADWWNSVSWDQYARDWNRPVHNFLLRHVYHSSISSMRVNRYTATLITFFLSAVVHELVMWALFKKLRGYLLLLQMFQLPLIQMSRSRWLKGRATLGNLIFWIGIFTGPSLLCSLYLII